MTDISVFTASFVLTCSGQRSTKQRAVPGTHVAPPPPGSVGIIARWAVGGSVHLTSPFNFWKSRHRHEVNEYSRV